ncbi:MAG: oligopeptide/dipeptide ABC transporter ATP-binding protein, partial [Spirochaetota bacterium]
VLIADEPTTALDVTIQAQILEIMQKLSDRLGTSLIMITHDLGVVAGMCDRIVVMYAGRIIEEAKTDVLFEEPKHPYTQGLIASVPRLDKKTGQKLSSIPGQPPNLIDLPDCCPFYPRCPHAMDICKNKYPDQVKSTDSSGNPRRVSCWLYS